MNESEYEVWVVDEVEEGIAVLVEDLHSVEDAGTTDSDSSTPGGRAVIQVDAGLLGELAVEGALLRVPIGQVGQPLWEEARRDLEGEASRRQEGEALLEKLKARDPGGDIKL